MDALFGALEKVLQKLPVPAQPPRSHRLRRWIWEWYVALRTPVCGCD